MSTHTFLLDLPDVLEDMGLNVVVADGYELGQGDYLWTNPHTERGSYDEKPFGYMVHHSAGTAATPPPHDTSKASAWIGLWRDGRLYTTGGGTPTIYLASAGPARVSSGYGYRPAAWDYTFEERRAPAKAQGSDGDTALNRYSFNVEVVHPGDGSPLDPGVWEHVVGLGVALEAMTGLSEMTLGHLSWTKRKIDPKWSVGKPNDGELCIIDVQEAVAEGNVNPPPIDPPPSERPMNDIGREQYYYSAKNEDVTGQDVEFWQNIALQVGTGIIDTGSSTKTYFEANAPAGTTWKVHDEAWTAYLSTITGRNSYGMGATERSILTKKYIELLSGG